MSTKIMVPVSGAPTCLKAVDEAIRVAREFGDGVIQLVNVQPRFHRHISRFVGASDMNGMREERARTAIDAAHRKVQVAGVPCETYMVTGRHVAALKAFAESQGVAQIVMATPAGASFSLRPRLADALIPAVSVPVEVVNTGPVGMLERLGLPAGLGLGLTVAWLAAE